MPVGHLSLRLELLDWDVGAFHLVSLKVKILAFVLSLALLAFGSKSYCQNTKLVHSARMSGLAPQSSTAFGITVTLETSLLRLISNYGKDNFDEND